MCDNARVLVEHSNDEIMVQNAITAVEIAAVDLRLSRQTIYHDMLLGALRMLKAANSPLASGAAQAHQIVRLVLRNTAPEYDKELRKAAQEIRRCIVARCITGCTNREDPKEFIVRVREASPEEVDNDLKSQLLSIYYMEQMDRNTRIKPPREGPRYPGRVKKTINKMKAPSSPKRKDT